MTPQEIIEYIQYSPKRSMRQVFISGNHLPQCEGVFCFGDDGCRHLVGDSTLIQSYLDEHQDHIDRVETFQWYYHSGIPLYDPQGTSVRIEPGAIIREKVTIEEGAVIMMNATINIGAFIGEKTMIDMNAVVGGNAVIKEMCHIGAGAVIAGTIEPASAKPVIIENHVFVGANAVIVEGVHVGHHSIIGAGSVVLEDVEPYSVMVGCPGKCIKKINEVKEEKYALNEDLR